MTKRITKQECQRRLDELNPNIKVVNYNGWTKESTFNCLICGHTWTRIARKYIADAACKKGCPRCKNNTRVFSEQEAQKKLDKLFDHNVVIVGPYIDASHKTSLRCVTCNYEWMASCVNLMHRRTGNGCPKCNTKSKGVPNRNTLASVQEAYKNQLNGVVIIDYDWESNFMFYKCERCGWVNKRQYRRTRVKQLKCDFCYRKMSVGEYVTFGILRFNDINFQQEYGFTNSQGGHQRIDFYLPEHNAAIEVQGYQHFDKDNPWHSDIEVRDELKLKWCEQHGIKMIYVDPENDMFNQLSKHFVDLKRPDDDYLPDTDSQFNMVISYLKDGHNKKDACQKFGVGLKVVDRFIRQAGYQNYFDLYHTNKMLKLGLDNDKIIQWLKHNPLSKVQDELGITQKYVISHIFHNPDYPFSNMTELRNLI